MLAYIPTMVLPGLIAGRDTSPNFLQAMMARQLMKASENFCSLAEKHGIKIQPHRGIVSYRTLLQMDFEFLRSVSTNFMKYQSLIKRISSNGISLQDDRSLTWYALSLMKLRPLSDIFDKMENGDVIEFYNLEYVQIFRNMRFFELCSYPLIDVLIYEWPDLYEREEGITDKVLGSMREVHLQGGATRTFEDSAYYEHEMWEKFSDRQFVFNCRLMYISPLYDRETKSKRPIGSLVLCRAKKIGEKQS